MMRKIIYHYGTVKRVYLAGPENDIQHLYLLFKSGRCFRIYLKGFFHLQEVSEPVHSCWNLIQITRPETAYKKLVYCDYVHAERAVIKASDSTLQAVLDLLLESIP